MATSDFPFSSLPAKLVNALYAAVALRPRASMGELAVLAGISRATLHRYCGTRDNLDCQLEQHAKGTLMQILDNSGMLAGKEPLAALRQLIHAHLAQGELIAFLASRYPVHMSLQHDLRFYVERLDALFFSGQRQGVFRADVSAPLLTEMFVSLLHGMVDARQRGRAPSESATVLEHAFLQGIARRAPR
ncbi:TetR/AcrR family transcriptional regulator [Pseudomonas sp. CC120222-01a]|uniref:TetR/AcrR family transcriptional regulator n=1 Tax=Pseudomonas sp. CC120222-01a TaxID=1378075 RepID=UPI001401C072|nr:TetR/AcrR family transcriptional regulator [Pseudomonas sp. CC120222-01a]